MFFPISLKIEVSSDCILNCYKEKINFIFFFENIGFNFLIRRSLSISSTPDGWWLKKN